MILANASDAQTLNADFHAVPTVHYHGHRRRGGQGVCRRRWQPDGNDQRHRHHAGACPEMAGFSSTARLAGDGNLLKPDITAPGVDIIAAVSPAGDPTATASTFHRALRCRPRTSRASRRWWRRSTPLWTLMEIKSALMTSATTLDNTGQPIQRAGADATRWTTAPATSGRSRRSARPGLRLNGHRLDPLWLRHRSFQLITDPSFLRPPIGRPEQPQLPEHRRG